LAIAVKVNPDGSRTLQAIGIIADVGPNRMTGEGGARLQVVLQNSTTSGSESNNIEYYFFANSAHYWQNAPKQFIGEIKNSKNGMMGVVNRTNQEVFELGYKAMCQDIKEQPLKDGMGLLQSLMNNETLVQRFDDSSDTTAIKKPEKKPQSSKGRGKK
jgi:hypothetical protein